MNEQIDFFSTNSTEDISYGTLWDTFKAYIRGQIISYTVGLRKRIKKEALLLVDKIKEIDKKYLITPSKELYKQRVELQTEYSLLLTSSIENQLMKSRSDFYIHSDKSGKLLASQLKNALVKRQITKIRQQNGDLTVNHDEINKSFQDFYTSLCHSEFPQDCGTMCDFLGKLNFPKLSPDDLSILETPMTNAEIKGVISSMNSGKAPGPDGYTAEFLECFSTTLSPWLYKVFEEAIRLGNLPQSFYRASSSLILKKDKDPTDCASYRPISLLNVNSKIFSKLLASRLEMVLPQIISEDLTGFIKNRYSFFNVRRLLNIVYTPSHNISECVISLDAEKAFDRVEWPYLFNVLEEFNFSLTFISWIKLIYHTPVASVFTNNQRSPFFCLFRGTRQGCPLSPLLFDIALEPLAIAIRESQDILGINHGTDTHKLSLYADDLLIFISNPEKSIPVVLSLLAQFSDFSGYKLNLNKSELFPLNRLVPIFGNLPFKLVNDSIIYLGIKITKNHKDLFKVNFVPLIDQMKCLFTKWSPLSLSLIGRINAIKMVILPKFLYIFQAVPIFIPKSFFTNVDSKISTYICQNKNPRLGKIYLQKAKKEDGLALPNFRFYYWAVNIRYLICWLKDWDGSFSPHWVSLEIKSVLGFALGSILGTSLPFALSKLPKQIDNPIVKHTLRIWFQFQKFFGLTQFVLNIPIVSNCFIHPSIIDQAYSAWKTKGLQ
ncbi:IQ calmodulin-binding motif-containing protein 1 isoform X1 [Hypanus sabinus]|uniref:IQ calmodulin-binding motif-containing protein 1 isoform X1 n=1 Tax=Hypanus sabinus TaxID=79690 RepID=UPI0028C3E992|nr:IQ calmodulin-binding motif-containing protein 1 isoform X1 [Hypanus sabinus]XP_059823632.1 IQ calmodulin-binding motif-containing protein 1 isoform X1 [Hypanus sabinus]